MAHQTTRSRWLLPAGSDQDPAVLERCLAEWAAAGDRVRHTGPLPPPLDGIGAKIFRARTGSWRRLLGQSPAAREWSVATRLHARGLPVPEPLALGLGAGPQGEDAFLFRWHGRWTDLARAHQEGRLTPEVTRLLAPRLGALVRRFHAEGLAHRDLHAGNVLWDGDGELQLVDFHRARRWPWEKRRDVLDLARFFLPWARPADLLRFLRAYRAAAWPVERHRRHASVRRWQSRAHTSLRWFLRHHERRCLGSGRAYVRLHADGLRGVALRPPPTGSFLERLADVERLDAHTQLVHRGRDSEVRRGPAPAGGGEWACKVFEDPGWIGLLKRLGRGSRARRAWRAGMRLRMATLPTPTPHLFLEEACFTGRRRSLLVEEFLTDRPPLRQWWEQASVTERRQLAGNLARQLARLHDSFLSHRDLKAENLLVDPQRRQAVFLDADGIRRVRRLVERRVARDLMRLNASFRPSGPVSLSQRARFLRTYLRARRTGRPDRRTLWRRIVQETEDKWARPASRPH